MITVTKPTLPNLSEILPELEDVWSSGFVTNNGNYVRRFEVELSNYLDISNISVVSNATNGLLLALKALNITGEVITSPYSFVATTHVLSWLNLKPVFVDTDKFGNMDPNKIETAITEKTMAILPIHVYGRPCDTEKISRIAKKYNLKVIYDAAHAFGVSVNHESILNAGDISVLSFHATKVFNTLEGGAVICKNRELKKKIDLLRNFGIEGEETVSDCGINCKLDELRAIIGLNNLKTINKDIKKRKIIFDKYKSELSDFETLEISKNVQFNYGYFPIFINNRDKIYDILKDNGILTRKYFYPLISNLLMYSGLESSKNLPNANKISESVLCLPIYPDLKPEEQNLIIKLIKQHSDTVQQKF